MNASIKNYNTAGRAMLSLRNEKLLVRYFDGECGWIEKYLAEKLIQKNSLAREFMDTMHVIGEITRNERAGILKVNPTPTNLWDRISARIEAEEKSALFLGMRAAQTKKVGFAQRLSDVFSVSQVAWGASGAFAAACITYFFVHVAPGSSVAHFSASQGQPNSAIRQVALHERAAGHRSPRASDSNSLGRKSLNEPIRILTQNVPSALEVDWVKSAGHVRMMQDPEDRSAIIWIKRREPVAMAMGGGASLEQPSIGGEPLVIYNEHVPSTVSVSNR